KGAAWGDMDNDGLPELFVSVYEGKNVLLHNEGPRACGGWSFRDVSHEAGIELPLMSFATWWFDYDNDGWQDLLVTGYYSRGPADIAGMYLGLPNQVTQPVLYRNRHDGT